MNTRPHLIPALVMTAMLFLAIADLQYGYYQLLRWVVCGVAVYIAYMAYQWGKPWATWVFGLIAVLFNPIIPVHLTRAIWRPINITCAVLFASSALVLKKPVHESNDKIP